VSEEESSIEEEIESGEDDNLGLNNDEELNNGEGIISKGVRTCKAVKQPCPPARHLNIEEAFKNGLWVQRKSNKDNGYEYLMFCGNEYDFDGFHWHIADSTANFPKEVFPTIEELYHFLYCKTIPLEDCSQQLRRLEYCRMTPNTRVKIDRTEDDSGHGTMESLKDDVATVQIHLSSKIKHFHISCLHCRFVIGNFVKLVAGKNKGITGWVIDIVEKEYTATVHCELTGVC
jgi:transcription elongation factor